MSIVNLMLLGILLEKPMNAYEINKEVEDRNLMRWIKMSSPSVYRNIVRLAELGYLDGRVVKGTKMPEKTIYTINEKGKKYFNYLMVNYSQSPKKIFIDFTSLIANIHNVDEETGKEMLNNLLNTFLKTETILSSLNLNEERIVQSQAIIDLNIKMYILFSDWIKEFIEDYYK